MEITLQFLEKYKDCPVADKVIEWFKKQKETDLFKILEQLIGEDKFDLADWLITRNMISYKQYVPYAIYVAEQTLPIYEKEYPNDKRLRATIEAVKEYIKSPSPETLNTAYEVATYSENPFTSHFPNPLPDAQVFVCADIVNSTFNAAICPGTKDSDKGIHYASWAARMANFANPENGRKILSYGVNLLKSYTQNK